MSALWQRIQKAYLRLVEPLADALAALLAPGATRHLRLARAEWQAYDRFGRELLVFKKPSSGTFAQAVKMFGYPGTVNLAATMAAYVMTGIMLNAVDQQLPADSKPLLPVDE